VLLLWTVANGGAAAQEPFGLALPPTAIAQGQGGAVFVAQPAGQAGLLAIEPFESARPVLSAPYTADAVTEVTQVLADGNRIEHRTSAAVARDGRGRIRREHQAIFFGGLTAQRQVPLVTISDPSNGSHVTLDHERRVVLRMSTHAGMKPMLAFPPSRSARIVEAGEAGDDVRTEQLGAKDIEGVRADGTLTTMTIPAGTIGNQAAIDVVSERWYSPELQVVVLTRRSDPRFGETLYRLTNIVRGEPAPDLFEIPPGFKEETPSMPRRPRTP
jgi:hypothetical protein